MSFYYCSHDWEEAGDILLDDLAKKHGWVNERSVWSEYLWVYINGDKTLVSKSDLGLQSLPYRLKNLVCLKCGTCVDESEEFAKKVLKWIAKQEKKDAISKERSELAKKLWKRSKCYKK